MTIRMTFDQTTDGFENGSAPVGDKALSREDRQALWQNLTLILSALGAACMREHHDPSALTKIIPPMIIPDCCRVLRDPSELLTNFLTETVNFLVSDSPQVRDIAREALSNEASPRLYGRIVKQLDDVIRMVTDDENVNTPVLAVFLDQFITILKVLLENSQGLAEDMRSIDVPSTLHTLATFIGRVDDSEAQSLRLKLKFCQLCASVFTKTDTVLKRNKESAVRQSIVDIIVDWVQDNTVDDGHVMLRQYELNVAIFKAAVASFDRLQLEVSDGTTGEDTAHAVSRLFIRYATFLLKTWEVTRYDGNARDDGISEKSSMTKMRVQQRDGELREMLIDGLASLISANTECGMKHCLSMADDQDPTRRLIFAHVFTRVLKEGIKFAHYEETPVIARQSRLCELVKGQDNVLALAICEICPPIEVDSMNAVLLNLFDTRSSLMGLLKTMIDNEIQKTDSDTALFRSNSTCTRFLSAFARVYGYNYLRSLILPLVKLVTTMPPGRGYELDPSRVSKEELKQNKETVELITQKFLEIISSSIPALPSIIREICAHIAKSVNEVWPEAKFAALGAFIFLRFISPAIVTPETVDVPVPYDATVRRGLMVIAKIIQNLANNILFGKEAHMVILNDFLKENIVTVTKFLSEINKYVPPSAEDEADEWLERTYDETDTIILHRFFEKHADKIGKELLSSSKVSAEKMTPEAEAAAANGKRAWDALCAALVDLGQPLESPKLSMFNSREHREYLDLMMRCDRRDTNTVQELFVEAIGSPNANAVFVLSVSKIDVEVLDLELLLYYIFKCVTSPMNEGRDFDLILDYTGFTSTSQVPAQWLKFAAETIPLDIWKRLKTMRLLTPNTFALRYLRRLYNNLTSGTADSINITMHTSLGDLLNNYSGGLSAPSLSYANVLEDEPGTEYEEVTMRHTHPMRVPVTMRVSQSHIRITTTKALPISNALSCKATEIIPLGDINDVYNVSTGHDSHEFIIRKIRQGVTLYFSSPHRDAIVKTIRSAKSLLRNVQLPTTERHSRLSNIITTLLRIALLGVSQEDEEPRVACVELLSAICAYLDFEGRPAIPSRGYYTSGHNGTFLVMLSESLAGHAPQLTMDFISEMCGGISKLNVAMRASCYQYMGPWAKNLACFTDPTNQLYEPSGTRFRDCIRMLVDMTTAENELQSYLQKYIWVEIGKLDTGTVNLILDELMRAAVDGGMGSMRCEKVAELMTPLNSINVRGRVLARVRKVIGKTSIKPTRNLADNVHWNEIACLTRLLLVLVNSAKNSVQIQLFVPEMMHLVALIGASGQLYVRCTVFAIVTHVLHGLYSVRLTESTASPEIQAMVDECVQPEGMRLFGLCRPTPTSEFVLYDPPNSKAAIDDLESLNRLLLRVMGTISATQGLLNVWRARWMSLITSSAFQLSPAVQSRAFVSLGVLATSDVDDDLLYQMLVAFKTALSQSSETDTTSVLSMLRCITNVVPAASGNSRYLSQLFWLAVALLQSSHMALYVEAIRLLRVTVENMAEHGHFRERGVPATLLEGRIPLEDIACQLDHLLGLSFDSSFSFSLAATIFKGVRHSALRDAAEGALRSLLSITVRSCVEVEHADDGPGAPVCQDVLGYFLALLPMSTRIHSLKRLMEEANVDQSWLSEETLMCQDEEEAVYKLPIGLIGFGDNNIALLVTSFVTAMLATAQGDDNESAILYNILSDVADAWPDVIGMTYESVQDKVKEAFANSNSPTILQAVSNIFRVATRELERANNGGPPSTRALGVGSASTLSTVDEGVTHGPGRKHMNALEEQGMQGLVNSFQFLPLNRGHATKMIQWISELVMKMIE
ncbi:Neurofibromin [Trametes pubescens]|uniref:Neurofibromin n=1 Tax=Trametes pubescens TaxID=154538 RepID=A0A1M2VPJ5_TRAPU|nr:Neurofibromin [Trametes pubescens]